MKINLKHQNSNLLKEAKVGFSWTTFFFGIFVPLIRGDIAWCLTSLVLSVITFGFFWLIFPFFYNRIYIKNLLEKGYIPADLNSKEILLSKGWIAS